MRRKIMSYILLIALLVSIMPMSVFATEHSSYPFKNYTVKELEILPVNSGFSFADRYTAMITLEYKDKYNKYSALEIGRPFTTDDWSVSLQVIELGSDYNIVSETTPVSLPDIELALFDSETGERIYNYSQKCTVVAIVHRPFDFTSENYAAANYPFMQMSDVATYNLIINTSFAVELGMQLYISEPNEQGFSVDSDYPYDFFDSNNLIIIDGFETTIQSPNSVYASCQLSLVNTDVFAKVKNGKVLTSEDICIYYREMDYGTVIREEKILIPQENIYLFDFLGNPIDKTTITSHRLSPDKNAMNRVVVKIPNDDRLTILRNFERIDNASKIFFDFTTSLDYFTINISVEP